MTELHDSLKYLGPTQWSGVPKTGQDLENYLADLFSHAQIVLDSVPLPSPEDAPLPAKSQPHGKASKASDITLSTERSAAPPFGHEKYQKEWGKPIKIKAAENTLGLSVYKMSGKDGKGSWFARRSVHEGLGYNQFKRSLQMEFEKSLAEVGPPGTGNVRGIGGEERVEQIKGERGTVEVFRLSAQFPGPVAPRDFVTMLTTSERAMQVDKSKLKGSADGGPRHYMIISKPCDHPETQPRNGFVRGNYESVEFIREVPRKLKTSQSALDLDEHSHGHAHKGHHKTPSNMSDSELHESRKRASTVGTSSPVTNPSQPDPSDPEDNPVEWMMITRSDPGGGIPRFLVDRGTPGSICSDAVKFLDWACQNEEEPTASPASPRPTSGRRESHQSWRSRSLVGIQEHLEESGSASPAPQVQTNPDAHQAPAPQSVAEHHDTLERQVDIQPQIAHQETITTSQETTQEMTPAAAPGLLGTAAATLHQYTPQVILNHLPGTTGAETTAPAATSTDAPLHANGAIPAPHIDEEARSIKSATSFASAEDHWSSEQEEVDSITSGHSPPQGILGSKESLQHEAELKRLDSRKDALHKKFADTQTKYEQARARQNEQVQDESAKAQEKHEREMKKHEEKYRKELAKVERKREKEQKKMEAKMKKHADKDEKSRLTRERDEAREELDLVKKEAESLRHIVADLQKENTALVIKLGKAGMGPHGEVEGGGVSRSRGSSLSRKEK